MKLKQTHYWLPGKFNISTLLKKLIACMFVHFFWKKRLNLNVNISSILLLNFNLLLTFSSFLFPFIPNSRTQLKNTYQTSKV